MTIIRLVITIIVVWPIYTHAHSQHIEQWLQKYLSSEGSDRLSTEQSDMFVDWSGQLQHEIDAEHQLLEIQYMQSIADHALSIRFERPFLILSAIVAKIFHIVNVLERRASIVVARLSHAQTECDTIENSLRAIDATRQAILELHSVIWQAKKDGVNNAYCFGSVMCLSEVAYTTENALLNRVYKEAKTYSYQENRKKIAADSVRIGENDKVNPPQFYMTVTQ